MRIVSKLFGRWGAVIGLVAVGLFLAGCQSGKPDPRFSELPGLPAGPGAVGAQNPAMPPATGGSSDYSNSEILNPSDSIRIIYSDTPTQLLPFEDQIRADGTITLVQNQTFMAAGRTRRQLEEDIHERYVPKYFKTLTASVIRQINTRFYYVDGDVKQPGQHIYIGRTTVLKALASAGGFTDFGKRTNVKLTRTDGRIFTINCNKALNHPELDLEVYPDDKIWVARRLLW